MAEAGDVQSAGAAAPEGAAEVGVLSWRAKMVWPPGGFGDFIFVFGLVCFPILLGRFLGRLSTELYWVGIGVGALGVVAGVVVAWPALRRRMTEVPYRGPMPASESARISVREPNAWIEAAALATDDCAFEPIVVRTLMEPAFGELDAEGKPKLFTKAGAKKSSWRAPLEVPMTRPYKLKGRGWADLLCMLVALAAVVVMQRIITGSWWKGVRTDVIWTGIALAGLLAAFAKPTYVRISPGALDVVLYPALGAGAPVVERYDLRGARIVVDANRGWVGVFDASREARGALYLRTRWGLSREDLAAWVVRAARSRHETPPLPMDDLIG